MKTGLTFKDLQILECNTVLYQRGRVLKPRSRMASFTVNSDQFCRSETKTLVGSECLAAGPTPSLGVSSSPTDLLSGCARHQPSPAPSSTPGFTLAQGTMLVTSRRSVATTQQPPLNLESHLPAWHPSPHPLATLGWADLLELALPCALVALPFSVLTPPSSYPESSRICTALRLWPGKAGTSGCCQGHRHRVPGPWRMPDLHLGDATNFSV